MTETLQKSSEHRDKLRRRAFLLHAAELYGAALTVERAEELLGELGGVDDLAVLRAAFPALDDAALHEAAWALGVWLDGDSG